MASTESRRRTLVLVIIFGLLIAFGLVGAICIDQGRPVVANLAATADAALKVRGAALSVETARRLAAEGKESEASKLLGETVETLKSVEAAETDSQRRALMAAARHKTDTFAARFNPDSGATLADALADLDARQSKDILTAEVEGSASILNAAALYVVLLIIVVTASAGTALIGFRAPR